VAIDGTKIKANASQHKTMSYERMQQAEGELQAQIDALLERAKSTDAAEADEFGVPEANEQDNFTDPDSRIHEARRWWTSWRHRRGLVARRGMASFRHATSARRR
jgi:hypothetical protein